MTEKELHTPFELFGYECGPGWMPLVEKAQEIIDEWNEQHPNHQGGPLKFSQVKEKWGSLCMYLNFYPDEETEEAIIILENESKHYCEHCGTSENVKLEQTHGWYMTLCPKCRQEEIERYGRYLNKDNKDL